MRIFQVLFVIFFLGCQASEEQRKNEPSKLIGCDLAPIDVCRWRTEILEIDSILVDGEFNFVTVKDSILSKFGKPEYISRLNNRSLLYPNLRRVKGEAVEWSYGQTIVTGVGNTFVFSVIDFNSTEIKLISPRITLEKGTSAMEVCKLFPESCKLIMPGGGLIWSGHIELKASQRWGDRWRWYLWFRLNKLERIYLRSYALPY